MADQHPTRTSGPDRPLVFLHLPKTAGMTLRGILETVYAGHAIEFLSNFGGELRAFAERPIDERRSVALLAGHISWGAQAALPGARTITVLRDPVERMISVYHYNKRAPNALHHEAINRDNLSLRDAVESGLLRGEGSLQAAMLAGPRVREPRAILEAAKRNLRACAAFGLVERFDESVDYLSRELHWPTVAYESRNVSPGRPKSEQLEPDLVEAIRRESVLDAALYEDAAALFEARIRA